MHTETSISFSGPRNDVLASHIQHLYQSTYARPNFLGTFLSQIQLEYTGSTGLDVL